MSDESYSLRNYTHSYSLHIQNYVYIHIDKSQNGFEITQTFITNESSIFDFLFMLTFWKFVTKYLR